MFRWLNSTIALAYKEVQAYLNIKITGFRFVLFGVFDTHQRL
jgi:hypothetical protein